MSGASNGDANHPHRTPRSDKPSWGNAPRPDRRPRSFRENHGEESPQPSARDSGRPGAVEARRLALAVIKAVDDGAYANLKLPSMLRSSDRNPLVEHRDKAFATELAYGTIRMRRACDWLVQRHVTRRLDPETRRVLHLGAYQLVFLKTPDYAGVDATVEVAPLRSRGFVNAVLRKVARDVEPEWPDLATELSYPDWIVETLIRELGEDRGIAALRAMNRPAPVTTRSDGYVQDVASQLVGKFVSAQAGEWVLDLCAAPGGKATAIASSGATVVAVELHAKRAALITENAEKLRLTDRIHVLQADGTRLPLVPGTFERVLVDAPCSGLGSLRRRADARWRIEENDIGQLVHLQRRLMKTAAEQVCVGGWIVYSACTLTTAESTGLDEWVQTALPNLAIGPRPEDRGWEPWGRGARLLPGDTDGMVTYTYQRTE